MRTLTLVLFLCLSLNAYCHNPKHEAQSFRRDVIAGHLPERTHAALNTLLGVAYGELKAKGYDLEADKLMDEWRETYSREFLAYTRDSRDIGDHQSWLPWLSDKLNLLRVLLGDDIMKATHLADLYSFCYCPPIVFHPATFPMDFVAGERIDEYRRHFNQGSSFYGLTPIVVYWGTYATVTAATYGTGFLFISGIAAEITERLYAMFIGAKLSDFVFNKSTQGE